MSTYFTECSGGSWAPNWGDNFLWNVRTLLIGTMRNWASGVLLWNVALDEDHGPHRGGCADCRGVLTIDSAGVITRNEEYYVLAHAGRFVRPGAVRIGSSSSSVLEHVAFRQHDDGSVVMIVANPAAGAVAAVVSGLGSTSRIVMPARSVVTIRWPGRATPEKRVPPR
jgi:glucosylceramidase